MTAPPISVVIVTYNSADSIKDCITSVRSSWPEAELIVLDNGSTDTTLAEVTSVGLDPITGHGNVGFGSACNIGVERASSDLILLLNPDCVLIEASPVHELRRIV